MKGAGMAVAMFATVANAFLENCLYCRYIDKRATFLESWSYCPSSQECLADEWNYIDRGCNDEWTRANKISLEYCEASTTQCPTFTSSKQYDLNEPLGKHKNVTWVLPVGGYCNVTIDATEYVGRVLFDSTQGLLGVENLPIDADPYEKVSFEGEVG